MAGLDAELKVVIQVCISGLHRSSSEVALRSTLELDLAYAMSPFDLGYWPWRVAMASCWFWSLAPRISAGRKSGMRTGETVPCRNIGDRLFTPVIGADGALPHVIAAGGLGAADLDPGCQLVITLCSWSECDSGVNAIPTS